MVLAALSALNALGLMLIAEAAALGIVAVIEGTDAWRRAIALGVAGGIARAGATWSTNVAAQRSASAAKIALRQAVTARVLARGGHDLDRPAGQSAALATVGLEALDRWYATVLPAAVDLAVLPLLIWLRIVWADWVSALVILLTVPLIPLFMALIGAQTRDRVTEAADSLDRLSTQLLELARGLPVLVGLGRAGAQIGRLRQIGTDYRQRTMQTLRIAFLSSLALELIATISVAIVAVFIGLRLIDGSLSLQTGILVLILAPECYLPLRAVGAAFHAAEDGIEAMERAEAFVQLPLSAAPGGLAGAHGTGDQAGPSELAIADLTIRFEGRPAPVVEQFGVTVGPGELVTLRGPSGSGKSSVLAAAAGILGTTDDGSVLVEGTIRRPGASSIGWAPQHPEPFAETVLDEILLYGPPGMSRSQAIACLEQCAVAHIHDRSPAEVSPGEWRRVGLARVLARVQDGARVLLLDEPTAHLDAQTAMTVIELLGRLKGTVTMLVVTHDDAVHAIADRVVSIGSMGEVVAPLPPVEVVDGDVTSPIEAVAPASGGDRSAAVVAWRALGAILRPQWRRLLVAVILGVLATLAAIALLALSGWLIVRASQQPPVLSLLVAIVGVRFFGVARSGLRYAERVQMHDVMFAAMSDLRIAVWRALAAQGPGMARWLRGQQTIDLLIGDIDRVRDATPRVVLPPIVGGLAALTVTIGLGWSMPTAVGPMLLLSALGLLIAPWAAMQSSRGAVTREDAARSTSTRAVTAAILAAPDLAGNGLGQRVLGVIDSIDREAERAGQIGAWTRGLGTGIVMLGGVATALAMLPLTRAALASGAIGPELVAVLVLTPLAIIDPLAGVSAAAQQWPALDQATRRITTVIGHSAATAEYEADGPCPAAVPGRIESVTLHDLAARWPGMQQDVFTGIEADLTPGQWCVVQGPSGSGKSTLLAVLQGFLRPSKGRYLLNGTDTAALPVCAIRQRVGWCPQEAHLFDSSLRANLLVARSRSDAPSDAELTGVLQRVGLGPLLAGSVDGLETRVGPHGSHLSGGERQRLAVARVLLTDAEVILLDEPTAHLDRPAADALLADLRRGLAGRIVVLVSHAAIDGDWTDRRLTLGTDHRSSAGSRQCRRR